MDDEALSVEQFRRRVEAMGEESDHVHIVALTDALQVGGTDRQAGRQTESNPHALTFRHPSHADGYTGGCLAGQALWADGPSAVFVGRWKAPSLKCDEVRHCDRVIA
jgi:Peptidase C65 Otubain